MPGKVDVLNTGPDATITLNGDNATVMAGGAGENGVVTLRDTSGVFRIVLNAHNGTLSINRAHTASDNPLGSWQVVHIDGQTGDVGVGGNGQDGELALFASGVVAANPVNDKKQATIHLRAPDAIIRTGGAGVDGRVLVLNAAAKASITLDGKDGDIILANADCAEDFDVADSAAADPGTVMVIDREGTLQQSSKAYDKGVAGVISGAGDLGPGIVLDKRPSPNKRLAVGLVGKVYCKVDADYAPIEVGDLLTTSPTPGHAMKAADPSQAFGAVLGKALRPFQAGTGLIPILIALQ